MGRKIVGAIEEPIPFQGRNLHAGPSLGISVHPDDGDRAEILVAAADEDMYREKSRHHAIPTLANA